MRKHLGVAMALLLVFCGTASAATVPVTQLSGQFGATNPSVVSTNDGVRFGVYANGGTAGGSMFYSGANGLTLADISRLAFTAIHNTSDDNTVAVPYLRVFLNNDNDDVIFSPNTQVPPIDISENAPHTYLVTDGVVRYDDDCGDGINYHDQANDCDGVGPPSPYGLNGAPWATVAGDHAGDVISGIYVSAGFSAGADLSVLLTDLTVNGDTFCFNCAPTPIITNTTFVTEPRTNAAASLTCKGNTVRRLHAPRRAGYRIVSVKATLRGKGLKINGRTITANLTGQPEGNYNVRLTIKYRARSGKKATVKTTRNLSVVCA
jgi:hypothetical protein